MTKPGFKWMGWSWNDFGRWRWGRYSRGIARGFYLGPITVWGFYPPESGK